MNSTSFLVLVVAGIITVWKVISLINDKKRPPKDEEHAKGFDEDEADNSDEETCTCGECGEDLKEGETVFFEELGVYICKNCIDNAYPRKEKIIEQTAEIGDEISNEQKPMDVSKLKDYASTLKEFEKELDRA